MYFFQVLVLLVVRDQKSILYLFGVYTNIFIYLFYWIFLFLIHNPYRHLYAKKKKIYIQGLDLNVSFP